MAGSLVPIVVGYAIAHYATLLIVEGQRVVVNLSDPLGRGLERPRHRRSDREHRDLRPPDRRRRPAAGARSSVGHLLGIVAAHEKASACSPRTAALRGQWPMLVVMVGYTCAGLVLLFSP